MRLVLAVPSALTRMGFSAPDPSGHTPKLCLHSQGQAEQGGGASGRSWENSLVFLGAVGEGERQEWGSDVGVLCQGSAALLQLGETPQLSRACHCSPQSLARLFIPIIDLGSDSEIQNSHKFYVQKPLKPYNWQAPGGEQRGWSKPREGRES